MLCKNKSGVNHNHSIIYLCFVKDTIVYSSTKEFRCVCQSSLSGFWYGSTIGQAFFSFKSPWIKEWYKCKCKVILNKILSAFVRTKRHNIFYNLVDNNLNNNIGIINKKLYHNILYYFGQ